MPISTRPSAPPRVPPELVEPIIDHVAAEEHSTSTLKACSLVSRAFHYNSRKHLLAAITFVLDQSPHERSHRFLKTFNPNSNVEGNEDVKFMQTIRSLTITSYAINRLYKPQLNVTEKLGEIAAKLTRKIRPEKGELCIAQVFDNVTHMPLQKLTLRSITKINASRYATEISRIFHMPSLQALNLEELWNFPMFLIASAMYSPNIRQLVLKNIHLDRNEQPGPGHTPFPPAAHESLFLNSQSMVKELVLDVNPFLPFLLAVLAHYPMENRTWRFPRLKALQIQASAEDLNALWDWINQNLCFQLESLHILTFTSSFSLFYYAPFSIDRLAALRDLHFDLYPLDRDKGTIKIVTQVARLLKTAKSPKKIETVTVTVYMNSWDPSVAPHPSCPQLPQAFISDAGWRAFDKALTGPAFSSLIGVNVDMYIKCYVDRGMLSQDLSMSQYPKHPTIDARSLLPLLSNHPVVQLSTTVDVQLIGMSTESKVILDFHREGALFRGWRGL